MDVTIKTLNLNIAKRRVFGEMNHIGARGSVANSSGVKHL